MMVALLLYGYCQGERSSRVIEKRCVRDVAYRIIAGGLRPDHATIARFRAKHQTALGGLFSQVLRLLAAEGMVSLGLLSLDGTKLAGNAAQKADGRCRRPGRYWPRRPRPMPPRTPLRRCGGCSDAASAGRRAERRERLARPGTGWRLRTGAPPGAAGQAAGLGRGRGGRETPQRRRPADEPRAEPAGTEPRATPPTRTCG